ncbi:MAG TPA: addiction module protein [Terriglobia bacterium]|nr:addiction module protein [Terriglobia bacterium]
MADLNEILTSALSLSVDERAALAEELLASLDELDEADAERLWAREAQRRLDEYRTGCAKAVSDEEVARKGAKLFP